MRTVTVRVFAHLREQCGNDRVEIQVPDTCQVSQLRQALTEQVPILAEWVPRCAVAVDAEYAEDTTSVPPGAEIALLPPVSGGSGGAER